MSASPTHKELFERIYTENYVRLYYYALHIVNEEETELLNGLDKAKFGAVQIFRGKH